MTDLILHHYPLSPYAEKVRRVLAWKRLPWSSVIIPIMLPKPDLMPLTGGYRRTPVLQVGRDIYCDTSLILRVLDRHQPDPPLYPLAQRASIAAFKALEQTLFFAAVSTVYTPPGLKAMIERLGAETMGRLAQDRGALYVGGSRSRPGPDYGRVHFLPLVYALEQQLSESSFLLGDEPTAADFALYHSLWFVAGNAGVAPQLAPFAAVRNWMDSLAALGEDAPPPLELASEDALAIARSSTHSEPFDGPLLEPEGLTLGQTVQVNATDYGCDAIRGTLVHASAFEVAIQRQDERAGDVVVHFPREDFRITAA